MYTAYWQLKDTPFENTPDPRFLFHSAQFDEAHLRMLYVVRERKGAGMLTGVFGCGKTLIGRALMDELAHERYHTVYLAHPRLSDLDFLRMIAHQLGVTPPPSQKADCLIKIEEALFNTMRSGKETIVIVDEAHAIEELTVFEELRLLLNFQLKDRFLLTLLLFGQPELAPRVNALKPLEQRIAMKCHLGGLSAEETTAYIQHRLTVAGAPHVPFTPEALQRIYEHTGGIPRRINRLCDTCLLAGFVAKATDITPELVMEEVRGLGGEA